MAFAKLIAFDRPLRTVTSAALAGKMCSESEVAARETQAYQRGVDDARALADQQLVELRADIGHLADGVFKKLGNVESAVIAQLRETLPALALEISRRLLAGYEPAAEVVSQICAEALGEIFPERDNLELSVSPRDAALLEKLNPDWLRRYPGLRIRPDATLMPGDCQVRSRFGLTDARLETKLAALQHSLAPV